MRKGIVAVAAVGLLAAGSLTACGEESGPGDTADRPKIGVILPDSKSSGRWETADRKYLEEAFKAAGVDYDIQNAQGDKSRFQTIADQMITSGVNVLMIVNLDSGTGKAVLDKAKSQGIATIDYDRLTLGGWRRVLRQLRQRQRSASCRARAWSSASTTKASTSRSWPSSTARRPTTTPPCSTQGYDSVLKPKFDSGDYVKGPERVGPGLGQRPGRHRSSSRCSPRPTARSTACSPPTTASATRRSRS